MIITLLIVIGYLVYRQYKNKRLKSKKHKSAFAAAYADCFVPNASSSAPLKRNAEPEPEPENYFTHINKPLVSISDIPKQKSVSGVLEFYFEYEDEYKI